MRRFRFLTAFLATVLLVAGLIPSAALAAISSAGLPTANILIDGVKLNAVAYNVDGRIMAPLWAIFEALGAEVGWDQDTQTATGTKGNKVIKITIDSDVALVDGKPQQLAVPAMLIDSRTFVPVRFSGEALGANVQWDGTTQTVNITFNADCKLTAGQKHEGTIAPGGETWGVCGSPHFVTGEFMVAGKDSPVLTIEAGAIVRFAEGASITVGYEAPGGLMVNGTQANPVTLTGDMLNPQPGYWPGIRFYGQTIRDKAELDYTKIQYAGSDTWQDGAIWVSGTDRPVEITLKNVTISNSLQTGLKLVDEARLSSRSTSVSVNGTVAANENGGFPIVTSVYGSNSLPRGGTFEKNVLNAVEINTDHSDVVAQNTTWRNLGIPYAIDGDIEVKGAQTPVLTIEPGVTTLWKNGHALWVGYDAPGTLKADATAKPEGNGDWKAVTPEDLTALAGSEESLAQVASSARMESGPTCGLCKSSLITFGSWSDQPTRGSWEGIIFHHQAGSKNVLNGVVVAYGGANTGNGDFMAANVVLDADEKPVAVSMKNTLLIDSSNFGLYADDNSSLTADSTGNTATKNLVPARFSPNAVLQPGSWNGMTGNDHDWISIWADSHLTKTGTLRNLGLPYLVESDWIYLDGDANPVLTIEPGTTLQFKPNTGIEAVTGAIAAAGTSAKPIVFTGSTKRAGSWSGIYLSDTAADGNAFNYVTVEYATKAFDLRADFGPIIRNTTIKNSSEMGIQRGYDLETGTDFTKGLGNQFLGNAHDTNLAE